MIHILIHQYIYCFCYNLQLHNKQTILHPNWKELNMELFYKLKLFYVKQFGKKAHRNKVLFDHHFFINKYYLSKSASIIELSKILNI